MPLFLDRIVPTSVLLLFVKARSHPSYAAAGFQHMLPDVAAPLWVITRDPEEGSDAEDGGLAQRGLGGQLGLTAGTQLLALQTCSAANCVTCVTN